MKRRIEMRLLHTVGVGLGGAILVVTVLMGWTVYADLYQVILDGFDRKLKAISTTTGSFISGDEHRKLERTNRLRGLAYDADRELLYRVDPASRMLVEIDPSDGTSKMLAPIELTEVRGLSFDPTRERLAALVFSEGQSWLYALDRSTGRADRLGNVGFPNCRELAFAESTDSFYCLAPVAAVAGDSTGGAGTVLVRIDPSSGEGEESIRLGGEYRLLTSGPGASLVGFRFVDDTAEEGQVGVLESFRLSDAGVTGRMALRRQDWMNGVFGLAWTRELGQGWLVTDRFLEVSLVDEGSREIAYTAEDGALYRQYGEAMRGTLSRAGITYLYTQVADRDPEQCIYILNADCTADHADHTPLGSEDELPPESVLGQRDVLSRAEIFLSSVRVWEKWGLLKNAFAPIVDESGEVSAIAGADVNISIIRAKTRTALLKVFAIGAVFFIMGLLVSYLAARGIVGPIAEVKEAALRFGAGDYSERIATGRLRELEQLSTAFNGLGETLENAINRKKEANEELETMRRIREMEEHLSRRLLEASPTAGAGLAWRLLDEPGSTTASGILGGGAEGTLAWLAPFTGPRAEAIKRRFEISTVLERELETKDPSALWARLELLFPQSVDAYIWVAHDTSEIRWHTRESVRLRIFSQGGARTEDLVGTGLADLDPGSGFAVISEGAAVEGLVQEIAREHSHGSADARTLLEKLDELSLGSRWGLSLLALGRGAEGTGSGQS